MKAMLFEDPKAAHEMAQKNANLFQIPYCVFRLTTGQYKVQREVWTTQHDGTVYRPNAKAEGRG